MWKSIRRHILEFFEVFVHEFRLVGHDGGLILFFTFLPLAYPVVYSLIYNPEVVRDVPIVVVDHDRTPRSRELVRKIDATQETWVKGYAADLGEARRAMASQDCFGILEIPEGFDRRIGRGETAQAVIYSDMTLLLRYKAMLVSATSVMEEMGAEIQQETISRIPMAGAFETEPDADLLPVHNIPMGNIVSGFDSFIMPGVIVLILHQCIILACGMAGGAKRENPGVIGYRSFNEQPSVWMTMLGQMLCYFTILILPTIYLIHYIPIMFRFPVESDTLEVFAFLLPMVIACLSLGFCLQGVVWERETVFVIWVVTSVAFLFLSGITWPRYAMPWPWKALGAIIPGTWGVEGFIRMSSNGASIGQVRDCYVNLWILAVVYTIAAYFVQRYVVRPSVRERVLAEHTFS